MSFPLSLGYSPSGVMSVLHLPHHSSDERFAFATSFETVAIFFDRKIQVMIDRWLEYPFE
ncbi:4046_t:CDS:2, partial [Entrophospora sp. SA101]